MTQSGYYKVGLFTFAGIILIVVLLVFLGAGSMFQDTNFAITYFDQSVQGLSVGSAVQYRGVRLGSVSEIGLCADRYDLDPTDPEEAPYSRYVYVILQLPMTRGQFEHEVESLRLESMIESGFRVMLAAQGITGLSVLEGDYVDPADNPPIEISWNPKYPYIPSAPSTMVRIEEAIASIADISKQLRDIDYRDIGNNIREIVEGIERIVGSLDFESVGEELQLVLADLHTTMSRVSEFVSDERLRDLPDDIDAMIESARESFETVETIVERIEPVTTDMSRDLGLVSKRLESISARVDEYVARPEVGEAVDDLPALTAELRSVLRRANMMLATGDGQFADVVANLRIITDNLRELTDNARVYPSQILFGDPPTPAESAKEKP